MSGSRIEVVQAVMAAWGRHDVDELLGHMAKDVQWHYQVGSRPVHGVDNMRKVLDKLKTHQLDSRWRLVRHAEAEDAVFIEAVDDHVNPDDRRVRVPYMGVYEFDDMSISV
jgi:limonene-1,2-epoxide hydrolase